MSLGAYILLVDSLYAYKGRYVDLERLVLELMVCYGVCRFDLMRSPSPVLRVLTFLGRILVKATFCRRVILVGVACKPFD
jgi:hypothetical protein